MLTKCPLITTFLIIIRFFKYFCAFWESCVALDREDSRQVHHFHRNSSPSELRPLWSCISWGSDTGGCSDPICAFCLLLYAACLQTLKILWQWKWLLFEEYDTCENTEARSLWLNLWSCNACNYRLGGIKSCVHRNIWDLAWVFLAKSLTF